MYLRLIFSLSLYPFVQMLEQLLVKNLFQRLIIYPPPKIL